MNTVHTGFPNFGFQTSGTQNSKKKRTSVDLGRHKITTSQRTKTNFLSNLWTWANLCSIDNTNSLVDVLALLGCR